MSGVSFPLAGDTPSPGKWSPQPNTYHTIMPLLIPSPLRLYSPDSTHHGGGAHGVHHYEDLCPKTLEAFHKMAFDHEYEVRLRYTSLHGSHYAALCGLTVMGLYPNLAYAGRGRPPKSFTPMLLVPVENR